MSIFVAATPATYSVHSGFVERIYQANSTPVLLLLRSGCSPVTPAPHKAIARLNARELFRALSLNTFEVACPEFIQPYQEPFP
ncbi:hypothetical protein [Leptolyngbya sp. FACHB-8]|uniref:hypothetical protein n=1 Tax=unclassified Leptolyngbya TaxID=2650499 RepID=UPI0016859442|nr:hypothetical protein [Leptolyngbya sp. FACHB-8]MBD1913340.1 hypothetical protein [Leptolyngbya sp. FACHB-8]